MWQNSDLANLQLPSFLDCSMKTLSSKFISYLYETHNFFISMFQNCLEFIVFKKMVDVGQNTSML